MDLLVTSSALTALALGLRYVLRRPLAVARTGEVANNPSEQGTLSLQGTVQPQSKLLRSPCSQQPCLFYEVVIERRFEKVLNTKRGTTILTGFERVERLVGGSTFELDDGSGPVSIDASDATLTPLHDGLQQELHGREWGRTIRVGHLTYTLTPIGVDDGWTIGFRVTERYVPAEGTVRVVGRLAEGLHTPRAVRAVTLARAV
jgi:hypothetical protein